MSERSSAQANTPTSANMQYGYPGHFDLMNMQPMQNPTDMYSYYTPSLYAPFNAFDEHNQWATADTPGNVPPPGPMPFHQMYTPSPLDIPRAPFEYPPATHAYPHYLPSYPPSSFPAPPTTGASTFDMSWNPHSLSMQPMQVAAPQPQLTPIGGGLPTTKKPAAYEEYPTSVGVGDMLAQHMNTIDLGGNIANDDIHHNYDNGTNDPTTMLAGKEQQQQPQQQQQQQQQYQSTSSNLSLSSTRPSQAPPASTSNGPKSYASVVSADTLNSSSNKSTPSVSNVPVRSTIQSSNNEHNPTPSNYSADLNNNPRSNTNFRGNNYPHSMNNYNQQNRNGSAGFNPRYQQQQQSSGGENYPSWNNNNSPTNARSANNHHNASSTYYNSGSSNYYERQSYSQHQTMSSPNNNSNRRANSNYQQNYPPSRTNPNKNNNMSNGNSSNSASAQQASSATDQDTLEALKRNHQYNPDGFSVNPKGARFFVIKSYSEDDVHRSIKYNIWCSTENGNKRLDAAFREREGKGPIYLFFSVNASGHFCGMAEMMSPVDYEHKTDVWQRSDKWQGKFEVKWIYVKDVPNQQLRHIRLENNENKPVTNSRDTQEIPYEKGKLMLKTMHMYHHKTSIFDDFQYYESKQAEEETKKPLNNDYNNNTSRGNNNNPKRQYSSHRTSAMQHEQQQYHQDNSQHENEQ